MPIRINLLAEEQAAEEMRRRDPVKRAIFAGAALTLLMIGWIGITQMNVMAARRDLAHHSNRLKELDDSSKETQDSQMTAVDMESRLEGIEKYSKNRFYWGTLLDAVQQVMVDNVRLMEIRADQKHGSSEPHKFFTTNISVSYTPPPASWKFWASGKQSAPIATLVSNTLASVTNKAVFSTNQLRYTIKIVPSATNATTKKAQARVEFTNPAWTAERTTIEIRGRDYGTPFGVAIDEFARRINASPYFKNLLVPVEGFKFTERPPLPRPDPQDPVNPTAMFVPFTIELTLKQRLMTDEQAL